MNGRNESLFKIINWLQSGESHLYISADSKDEALLFFISSVYSLDEKVREAILNTSLVIENSDIWIEIKENTNELMLIPYFQSFENLTTPKGCRLVVPFGKNDIIKNNNVEYINRQTREQFSKGLEEMGIESTKAYDLSDKVGRSLLALRRQLATVPWVKKPRWVESGDLTELIPALLIGTWNEHKQGDRDIVSKIANCDYESYIKKLTYWLRIEDSPIRKTAGVYQIVSIVDAWDFLWESITYYDIELFEKCILEVFQFPDPTFELEEDKWHAASVYGKESKYSHDIVGALVKSLIMLAIRDNLHNSFNITTTQGFVDNIVRKVYYGIDTWEKWFTISKYMCFFAEASPDETLKFIEKQVDNEESSFHELFKKTGDGLWGRNYYTHILWALEIMSWSKDYAPRACLILAMIAERNYKYKISNSPDNSLYEIFIPWHPQTSLNLEERIELLKHIIKEAPNAGWRLIIKLLPDTWGGVVGNTPRPKWRNWDENGDIQVTIDELHEQYKHLLNIAISNAGKEYNRWVDILGKISGQHPEHIEYIIDTLGSISTDFDHHSKMIIRDKLREIISKHRKFADADWSMEESIIKKLEKLYCLYEPENIILKYQYLFSKWDPDLLQPQVYSSDNSYNWELEEQNIFQERKKALIEIYNQLGEDGIITLLNNAEDIHQVGTILVDIFGFEIKWDFALKVLSFKKHAIVANYFCKICHERGINEITKCFVDNNYNFTNEQKVDILTKLPFINDVWKLAEKLGEEIKTGYWSSVNIWPLGNIPLGDKNYIIENLIQHNRPYTAIKLISFDSSYENSEKILQVLEKGLQLFPTSEFNGLALHNVSHEILRLFKKLYQALDIDTEKLLRLEWHYLPILRFSAVPKTLIEELKKNPLFFVELICWIYKGENEEHIEFTQEEENRAYLSYELRGMFKSLPGFKDNGEIDKEYFTAWMLKALNGCREINRGIIGEQEIGKQFLHSPIGTDGDWPHEIIRDFIEKYYTENIEIGFCIGRYNQRGVFTRTGGKEERRLAKSYYSYADRFRIHWPKCAAIMKKIDDNYLYQARKEEEEEQY